jgi:hypothetical protein
MAHGRDGGPLWDETMMAASELSLLGERLRPPKQSTMNSRLPKRMVSPWEKSSHDRRSLLAVTVSVDDGTIGTSRGKARYKSPYLARQLSLFSAPVRTNWSRSCIPFSR